MKTITLEDEMFDTLLIALASFKSGMPPGSYGLKTVAALELAITESARATQEEITRVSRQGDDTTIPSIKIDSVREGDKTTVGAARRVVTKRRTD